MKVSMLCVALFGVCVVMIFCRGVYVWLACVVVNDGSAPCARRYCVSCLLWDGDVRTWYRSCCWLMSCAISCSVLPVVW